MIYVHVIFKIYAANTDKFLQKKEKLVKFENDEALNEFSFNQVKKLEKNKLQYPGNGKMYVDFYTRTLTADEVKFLGLPA